MQSIREIQEKTVGYFAGKGVPNPKLDTDLLIAHVLGMKRLELYLNMERPLTEEELDALRPLVKRRAAREPLQYLLGTTEFYGLKLKVDARALIPRSETEEMVEHICKRMSTAPQRILDLGTGSGAIAIALAQAYPDAEVWATDQSDAALALAEENANTHVSGNRIHFKQGNWWDALPEDLSFDLIVSNPPYLTEAEMETAEPEVVDNEPREALVSGADGLKDLKIIIAGAQARLAPGGMMAFETGIAQHSDLDAICTQSGLQGRGLADLSGRPRFYFVEAPLSANHERSRKADTLHPAKELDANGGIHTRADTQATPAKHAEPTEACYFITCCTQGRQTGLEEESIAPVILNALNDLHFETSINLQSATVMPNHIHILFKLGRRLPLAQVIEKFKTATHDTLLANQLAWQDHFDIHQLRAKDAAELFSKYIFLNPYRAALIPLKAIWPWWLSNQNNKPEFIELLDDPPLPPPQWLEQPDQLDDLIEKDI